MRSYIRSRARAVLRTIMDLIILGLAMLLFNWALGWTFDRVAITMVIAISTMIQLHIHIEDAKRP